MNKKVIIAIFILLVLAISMFIIKTPSSVVSDNLEEIAVEIPKGANNDKIASILKETGLINSKLLFKLESRKSKLSGSLKPGNYILDSNMSNKDIIKILAEGPDLDIVKFNIPEGYELKHIAERLEEKGLVDAEKFLEISSDKSNFEKDFSFLQELEESQSLEGFLFPATYEVFKNEGEEKIISRMLSAFENIYNNDLKDKIKNSDYTLNEIVTLASIIEREGKIDEERPLMSAVFYNRIEQNMRLQSCATVQYIIGERKEHLTNKDTSTPSVYNTYLHQGLPPAPIAAPGKASLIAAIEPANVDYLYFTLTGKDGSHTFTKSYEDHLEAGKKIK